MVHWGQLLITVVMITSLPLCIASMLHFTLRHFFPFSFLPLPPLSPSSLFSPPPSPLTLLHCSLTPSPSLSLLPPSFFPLPLLSHPYLFLSLHRSEDKWGRQSSLKTPSQLIRRPSLGFDSMPPEDLAEVLASIDYKLFRRIPVSSIVVTACHRMIMMSHFMLLLVLLL